MGLAFMRNRPTKGQALSPGSAGTVGAPGGAPTTPLAGAASGQPLRIPEGGTCVCGCGCRWDRTPLDGQWRRNFAFGRMWRGRCRSTRACCLQSSPFRTICPPASTATRHSLHSTHIDHAQWNTSPGHPPHPMCLYAAATRRPHSCRGLQFNAKPSLRRRSSAHSRANIIAEEPRYQASSCTRLC